MKISLGAISGGYCGGRSNSKKKFIYESAHPLQLTVISYFKRFQNGIGTIAFNDFSFSKIVVENSRCSQGKNSGIPNYQEFAYLSEAS